MRILLDTQVWLWMLAAPERLASATQQLVAAPDNELLQLMARTGVVALPVLHRHALHVATLPQKHRDPFDRLLVAQAQIEGLPILSSDRAFGLYDITVLPA